MRMVLLYSGQIPDEADDEGTGWRGREGVKSAG